MLVKHFALSLVSSALTIGTLSRPLIAQIQNCPDTCWGTVIDNINGSVPAGADWIVVIGTPTNGAGTEGCNSTCTPCKVGVAISFYGNGTSNCVVVDHGGSGWSSPLQKYNRIGYLYTQCDGSADCLSVQIGSCGALPGGSSFSEEFCLFCAC